MKKTLLLCSLTLFLFSCRKETNNAPGTLPNTYSDQSLGAAAKDMLAATNYSSINIQVQYMPGYALDTIAINNVTAYLSSLCNKPGGVTITQTQIPADTTDTFNVTSIAILESLDRTLYNSGSTLALYIIVTNGYDTAVNTLGFAYRATSICLFGGNIFTHSGGFGEVTRDALESGVLEHELGHIMGLVNNTTPMVTPHQDTAHGYHCNNSNCLMYYAMETNTGLGLMGANRIPVLDDNCKADLTANGGK